MKAEITIYTAGLTRDSLDPQGTISDEEWQEQRDRYIDWLASAIRRQYPEATVDTEPGNGIDNYRVYVDDGQPAFDGRHPETYDPDRAIEAARLGAQIEYEVEEIGQTVYQAWCETVQA